MLRTEALAALAKYRGDMISVPTMRAVEPWEALGQADRRTYNVMGCMGAASSIGLGIALARPDERVLVIDGDGSLLMQLGSLVSIATQRPKNLWHVVMENGVYETSGSQSVPGSGRADICAIALASGYPQAFRFESTEAIDAELPACLELDGPVLLALRVTGPGVVTWPEGRVPNPKKVAQAIEQLDALRRELGATVRP
jgi:phosphonopyruvate decarboxylase